MSHLDEEKLTALLDGELSDLEARQVREHLAGCAECTARFDEIKGFFHEADRLVQVLAFPQASPPVVVAPTPALPAPPARKPWPLKQLAWAASLLLAIGFGYYGNELWLKRSSPETDARVASTSAPLPADQVAPAEAKATGPATPAAGVPAPTAVDRMAGRIDASLSKDEAVKRRSSAPPAPAQGFAANEGERDKESRAKPDQNAAAAQPHPPTPEPATALMEKAATPSRDAKAIDSVTQLSRGRAELASKTVGAQTNALQDAAPAARASGYADLPIPAPVRITMETAIQALGGTIHLIDGMSPDRVERLTARAVPGAHAGLPVIRVIYLDAPMREIWLDQQRGLGASAPRDTVLQWTADGGQNMQWMTGTDDWLSLTAHLTADSLKTLAHWVR